MNVKKHVTVPAGPGSRVAKIRLESFLALAEALLAGSARRGGSPNFFRGRVRRRIARGVFHRPVF
ncbi:MAG: hypothetical protein LBF41_01650, partial [Deltaproteobacteria bacterium]|nr:hypothetical protein [Deltaproteobacteria bacterium]